jgi:hypothetical protein
MRILAGRYDRTLLILLADGTLVFVVTAEAAEMDMEFIGQLQAVVRRQASEFEAILQEMPTSVAVKAVLPA